MQRAVTHPLNKKKQTPVSLDASSTSSDRDPIIHASHVNSEHCWSCL